MVAPSNRKKKGTNWEQDIETYLFDMGVDIHRLARTEGGRARADEGDLEILWQGQYRITVQAKNHKAQDLAHWIEDAQDQQANADSDYSVVAHKRRLKGTKDGYVTMTMETFAYLLTLAEDDA